MPRSPQEQEAWERQAYGCLAAEFKHSVEESLPVKIAKRVPDSPENLDKSDGYGMCAMSVLSDAQEMIEHGDRNGARQAINRAKLLIADFWMKREGA